MVPPRRFAPYPSHRSVRRPSSHRCAVPCTDIRGGSTFRAMPIVDAHQHVGDLAHSLSFDGQEVPPETPVEVDAAARVAFMDSVGIDWAVLQPSHGYLRTDGIEA